MIRNIKILCIISLIFGALPDQAYPIEYTGGSDIKSDLKKPAMVEADEMHYDKKKMMVSASGSVKVMQGDRILMADKVSYDQKNNVVKASGNISLLEPDGSVVFADEIELKDDLKAGIVDRFSAKFKDESRLAANKAERLDEDVTVLEKVVYSPCPLCEDDPKKAPLWQVKANKATIDRKEQRVKYNNAFFEVKGVPVLYTPYLSHATPDADRKSGFLVPKYSTDRIFGTTVKTPYYYNIAPNKDATITPIFTSNEGPILSAEYRHLVEGGQYQLEGSITNPDKVDTEGNPIPGKEVRGHIEGIGHFDINEEWSWGFKAKRSTDDTYLRRYNFGDEDVLTSRAYADRMSGRDYAQVETISFQGLKESDDPGQTPLILPGATMHFEGEPGFHGSRWFAGGNIMSLSRDEGVSSRRLSMEGGFKIPHTTNSGHVFELSTMLRGDGYSVDNVQADPSDPSGVTKDGMTSRVIPEAKLKWSLPLIKNGSDRQFFVEPLADVIVSPYGGNPDKIPNEDSQDVEFSDDNLFNSNRFTGYDRVENGPRVNYGVRGRVHDYKYGDVDMVVGQNYRAKKDRSFDARSGLEDNFSDYVGRIGYQKEIFDIAYRFRMDKDSLALNRNAVSAGLNFSPLRFDMDYISVDEDFDPNVDLSEENREIMLASSSLDITKKWTVSGSGHRNLEDGEWVSTKADLLYKGDCVDVGVAWFREFTRDRDIRPNTTLSLQVSLKNLGY